MHYTAYLHIFLRIKNILLEAFLQRSLSLVIFHIYLRSIQTIITFQMKTLSTLTLFTPRQTFPENAALLELNVFCNKSGSPLFVNLNIRINGKYNPVVSGYFLYVDSFIPL